MSPVKDYTPCLCFDPQADWCPRHAKSRDDDHDTIPEMAAVREIEMEDGEDKFIVALDVYTMWMSTKEPRIPLKDYVQMFGDIGEDVPTSPDCPMAMSHD